MPRGLDLLSLFRYPCQCGLAKLPFLEYNRPQQSLQQYKRPVHPLTERSERLSPFDTASVCLHPYRRHRKPPQAPAEHNESERHIPITYEQTDNQRNHHFNHHLPRFCHLLGTKCPHRRHQLLQTGLVQLSTGVPPPHTQVYLLPPHMFTPPYEQYSQSNYLRGSIAVVQRGDQKVGAEQTVHKCGEEPPVVAPHPHETAA